MLSHRPRGATFAVDRRYPNVIILRRCGEGPLAHYQLYLVDQYGGSRIAGDLELETEAEARAAAIRVSSVESLRVFVLSNGRLVGRVPSLAGRRGRH